MDCYKKMTFRKVTFLLRYHNNLLFTFQSCKYQLSNPLRYQNITVVSSRCKSFASRCTESVQTSRFVPMAVKIGAKLSKMAKNSVLLALNSLSSDGMVRLTSEQHQQFEALVEDYLDGSDGSDDESSGSDNEMECGKYLWLIKIHE